MTVLPSGKSSKVKSVLFADRIVDEAFAPQSVTLCIEDDIDISRGDLIYRTGSPAPRMSKDVVLTVCWLREEPLQTGRKYIIRQSTAEAMGVVRGIDHKTDINTLEHISPVDRLEMNDIAQVRLHTAQPLVYDLYRENRTTGSLIFIDPDTNDTVGAGMITE